TRRLVDVAQDVIIRQEDCGTEEYVELDLVSDGGEPNDNLIGRIAASDFGPRRGEVVVERNREIGRAEFAALLKAFGHENVKVPVRSVLKCEAPTGVCQACYGRSMATGNIAQIGDA